MLNKFEKRTDTYASPSSETSRLTQRPPALKYFEPAKHRGGFSDVTVKIEEGVKPVDLLHEMSVKKKDNLPGSMSCKSAHPCPDMETNLISQKQISLSKIHTTKSKEDVTLEGNNDKMVHSVNQTSSDFSPSCSKGQPRIRKQHPPLTDDIFRPQVYF
jgi:hypothetical protein